MGCGQSKINLYPRRNKNGGKGNSSKKSGAAEKEADEEEGSAGAAPPDDADAEPERGRHLLPLAAHPPPIEISASQQDFFKMLDDKIDKGKDYDSSSETEVKVELERRRRLIDEWRSASQSTQSSQASPPTPARRRMPRPASQPPGHPAQPSPHAARRCLRQQQVPDSMSPPPRRPQSAQHDQKHVNGDWMKEDKDSPSRKQQASWKPNPKVAPCKKKHDVNDNQQGNRDYDQVSTSNQDISQITYNPTFQSHSPAHSAKNQPYIAQIVSYPMSQQVTPPSPPKYIAPPEEYQDPQNHVEKLPKQAAPTQNSQPIYYIHGNTSPNGPDLAQQRQQTAFHLQQYVAMKQAQQQMYTYLQRGPHTVFPNVEGSPADMGKVYEHREEYAHYSHVMRPHSAPTPVGVVRPMAVGYPDAANMTQIPMWSPMPPVATMGPWVPGQGPEMQYYPQSQFMPMYRPNSAGSAGTLTRYHKTEPKNVCQSINLVRQKPVGQIVVGGGGGGGQELAVCSNSSESASPASVSTDSGVSPGNSAPSCKSFTSSIKEVPVDKKKKPPPPPFRQLKHTKSLDNT